MSILLPILTRVNEGLRPSGHWIPAFAGMTAWRRANAPGLVVILTEAVARLG